jgi:hypothetical protein
LSALAATMFVVGVGSAARADDAKCQDGVAKGSRNVGNQEQKKNRKCVKDGSGDVTACVNAEGAKSAIKRTKLQDLYATGGKCDPVPALGVAPDPDVIADSTEAAAGNILRGAFGDPVDGIVLDSKCHDKIAKRAGKKFDTELKAFRSCVKDAAPLASQAVLNGCISSGVNDAKAQSTVQPKLQDDMDNQCTFSSPPAGLEDGACSGCMDAATCATCIGNIVDCEACKAMNNSSNGTADCDFLDDGVAGNGSCCNLTAGAYTLTQTSGGSLNVDGLPAFPFPAGGTVVQDVSAPGPGCLHSTVIPFPGGFAAPTFCIPALNFSTSLSQTGCGIGEIDDDGGSDYTITETGDTSAPLSCSMPASACPAPPGDSNVRVDVQVGDSITDACTLPARGNMIYTVPVFTTTWVDNQAPGTCPDGDSVYNAGTDILIVSFPQTLDFTTDVSTNSWTDLEADGCFLSGAGPAGGFVRAGTCLDLGAGVVDTAATGVIGSNGAPLYDLSFATQLPNTFSGPAAPLGVTCGSAPAIAIPGSVTRCVQ